MQEFVDRRVADRNTENKNCFILYEFEGVFTVRRTEWQNCYNANEKNIIFVRNMIKRMKIGLLGRIVIAIAAGVGLGYVAPEWFARVCVTFNGVFSEFLGFMIPLIILGFVAPAIADLGNRAGKMLVFTVALAYAFTLFSGISSYLVGDVLFPSLVSPMSAGAFDAAAINIEPYFAMPIPAVMSVMTALVLAFMVGLGVAYVQGDMLRRCISEFRDIVSKVIGNVVIPLLPIYIFGIFLNMTISGQVGTVLNTFVGIIAVIFAMHIALLLIQFSIASLFSRQNPLKMLGTMMPAYFTALGTQSSAATIPVTLRQAIKMGVKEDVAGFTVPLCATIHMSGSTMKIVTCAMVVMLMNGLGYDFGMFAHFVILLGVTIVAAPGIPGGAIMASLGLLTSILGFTDAQNALMIALYIAMDSFGTACNVTGDGAVAAIVNRCFGGKFEKK